jgi:hypothetical protein
MKVVDVQDGRPMAGAHVLFLGTAQEGTDGAWRQNRKPLRRRNNDERRRTIAPSQAGVSRPALLSQYDLPQSPPGVLKPGYTLLTRINTLRVMPDLDEVTTWQYNDQSVKMKPRPSAAERSAWSRRGG